MQKQAAPRHALYRTVRGGTPDDHALNFYMHGALPVPRFALAKSASKIVLPFSVAGAPDAGVKSVFHNTVLQDQLSLPSTVQESILEVEAHGPPARRKYALLFCCCVETWQQAGHQHMTSSRRYSADGDTIYSTIIIFPSRSDLLSPAYNPPSSP